jgi:hypothetical protein
MNENFITVIRCGECGEEFSHLTPFAESKEENLCFSLNLDFKQGKIIFSCPACEKLNTMELLSNENFMKNKKLPKIMRG